MYTAINYIEVGKCLRKIRRDQNITLREVQEKIGIDTGTISRIERGTPVKDENLAKVFAFYGKDFLNEVKSIQGPLVVTANDGTISQSLLLKLIEARKKLDFSLKDIKEKSSVKKSGVPILSISTLSAIFVGKLKKVKVETLSELLNILHLSHEVANKKMFIGINSSYSKIIEDIIYPLKEDYDIFNFQDYKEPDLISSLRGKNIQLAIMPYNSIKIRIELIPIAFINQEICFSTLRDMKQVIKNSREYELFFHEILARLKSPNLSTFQLLFHPEWVL